MLSKDLWCTCDNLTSWVWSVSRQWYLGPTWLHMVFLTSIPCAWTHCSCVFVSILLFYILKIHGVMSTDLMVVFKPALNNKLKPILSTLAWLLKRFFSLLSLAFLSFSACYCVCCLLSLLLTSCAGTRSQVKTWRGMTVLPPGPTTCPLACTRSCARVRRVPKFAAPPETSWAAILTSYSPTRVSIYAVNVGVGVWIFESDYCRAIYQKLDASHSGQGWPGLEMKLSYFRSSQKRHWGLENDLFTSCLEPTQILAFILPNSFFSLILLCISFCFWTSALLRGYMPIHRTNAQAHIKLLTQHTPKNTRTFTCTEATDELLAQNSSGRMGHPLVALWSSRVKVYALSHGNLLYSMIILLVIDVYH